MSLYSHELSYGISMGFLYGLGEFPLKFLIKNGYSEEELEEIKKEYED